MPARQEAAERGLLDRLDLAAERGQRRAPQPAQHLGIAPLALGPTGAQLAADQLVAALEIAQAWLDVAAKALACLGGRERPARAREAAQQGLERRVVNLQEDLGQAARRHRADRVAVASRVLGCDQAPFACDPHHHRSPLDEQRLRQILRVFVCAQVAAAAQ